MRQKASCPITGSTKFIHLRLERPIPEGDYHIHDLRYPRSILRGVGFARISYSLVSKEFLGKSKANQPNTSAQHSCRSSTICIHCRVRQQEHKHSSNFDSLACPVHRQRSAPLRQRQTGNAEIPVQHERSHTGRVPKPVHQHHHGSHRS